MMTTTNEDDRKQERKEARARAHMTVVGAGFRDLLGADRAAAVMVGPAVALLEEGGGADYAATFLPELARELDAKAEAAVVARGLAIEMVELRSFGPHGPAPPRRRRASFSRARHRGAGHKKIRIVPGAAAGLSFAFPRFTHMGVGIWQSGANIFPAKVGFK